MKKRVCFRDSKKKGHTTSQGAHRKLRISQEAEGEGGSEGKGLYCGFCGKEWVSGWGGAGLAGVGLASLNKFIGSGTHRLLLVI